MNPHRIYEEGDRISERCIHAWYFDKFGLYRRGHCNTTILYLHGNSGNITDRYYVIDICRRFNLNLLLIDYEGYGKSNGKPGPRVIYQDGEAAYRYLAGQVDYNEIIVWGESLGGTVACHVASKFRCRALLLLATFSSLEDIIMESIWPRALARGISSAVNFIFHPMDSKEYLSKIKCPVAIMHSRDDKFIPHECSKKLMAAIPHKKKMMWTIKGGHASPEIDDQTLKEVLDFAGIQAECLDHHISYVTNLLQEVTKDNPDMLPGGLLAVNV